MLNSDIAERLRVNRFVYEEFLSQFRSSLFLNTDHMLRASEFIANFAMINHPGIFSDGRLENHLLAIKVPFSKSSEKLFRSAHKRRVLHVATRVMKTGGHSRVLDKWIRFDRNSEHAVVLTCQTEQIPEYITSTCDEFDIPILQMPIRHKRRDRAAFLRRIAAQCDIIVLHQHPEDSIPICAFSCKDCPPVIFWNHAHYWFSFGSTVADVTMNSQDYFAKQSKSYRFAKQLSPLRFGAALVSNLLLDKDAAKQSLGLSPGSKTLLSMGNPSYFCPVAGANFFSAVDRVLDRDPNAELLLVGPDSATPQLAEMRNRTRVHAYGLVSDPVPYYCAADYALESFPHSSIGAFIEAVCNGAAFPIAAFASEENILRYNLDQFEGHVPRARSEDEWVKAVCKALEAPESSRNLAREIALRLRNADRQFIDSIETAYKLAVTVGHNPGPIGEGVDIPQNDAFLLAAQSQAGIESFDFLQNPLRRYLAKRRALKCNLTDCSPTINHEIQVTIAQIRNFLSRIWRYQIRSRLPLR